MPRRNPASIRALALALAAVLLAIMLALSPAARAHTGARFSTPFEPSDGVLACVRSKEGDYSTNTGNGYEGAYQMTPAFWLVYATPIPDVHWGAWGIVRPFPVQIGGRVVVAGTRASAAPPVFQDEAARNGIRHRGLQPFGRAARRACLPRGPLPAPLA